MLLHKGRITIANLAFLAVLATAVVFVLSLYPGTAVASTGINQELSFEGKITSSTGTNITDGNYNVEFQIWNGASCNPSTGSGCTAVWTEDYLTSNGTYGTTVPVAFTSGTFQVNLGSICSLGGGSCEGNSNSAVNFNSYPLYVSINVGTTSVCSAGFSSCGGGTGVMYPLIALTSSPYSFNSNELGGIASTGYIQTNPTSSQTIQPTTNVSSLIVEQNNSGSFANDVFDVQGSSGSADDFLQVTSTAANAGAVTVQSLGSNTLSLQSGGGINIDTNNVANTLQIGNTANAVAQTIDIGNNTTASSTDTLNLGSLVGTSATTIQAGTGNISLGTGNVSGTSGSINIATGNSSGGDSGNIDIDNGTNVPSGTLIASKTFESGLDNMVDGYGDSDTLAQSTAEAHGGTHSLAVTVGSNAPYWAIADSAPFVISITPGHVYNFSAWVRAGSNSDSITGEVDFSDTGYPGGGTIATEAFGTATDVNTGWTEISGNLVAPVGSTSAGLAFYNNGSATTGDVHYFDDIDVTDTSSVTEPSINVGANNSQAINIGNDNESGATSLIGGAGGVNISAGPEAALNIGSSSASMTTLGSNSNDSATLIQGGTGNLDLVTGDQNNTSGSISITTGNSLDGNSGNISIDTGTNVPSGTVISDDTFEGSGSGSLDDMSDDYGETISYSNTYANTGSYSLDINESNQFWGITSNYLDLPVTAGHVYYVTAWFRGDSAEPIGGTMLWSTGATANFNPYTDTTTGWTEMTGDVVAPAGATAAYIEFYSGDGPGSGTSNTYMDDLVVTDLSSITEPDIDIGAANAQAITVGNLQQAGLTSLLAGAGGIDEYGGSNATINIGAENDNIVNIGNDGGNVVLQGAGTSALQIIDASSNPIFDVDSTDDSVGIGTVTPTNNRLDIVGATSDNTTNALNITNSLGGNLAQVGDDGTINLDGGNNPTTMGYNTIGGIAGSGEDGYLMSNEFTAPTSGYISSLSGYVGAGGGVDSSPYNQYQFAIYSDSSGQPGTYLASSYVGTLNPSSAWDTLNLSSPYDITAGTPYWLVYWSNAPGTGSNAYNSLSFGGTSPGWYSPDTFDSGPGGNNGFPTSFPAGSSDNVVHSIYASYADGGLSISSSGNLSVYGTTNFQDSADSSNAFTIQNADGESVLQAGTISSNNYITDGDFANGSGSTLNDWTKVGSPTTYTQNTTSANTYEGATSLQLGYATGGSSQGVETPGAGAGLTSSPTTNNGADEYYTVSFEAMEGTGGSAFPASDFTVTGIDSSGNQTCTGTVNGVGSTNISTSGFEQVYCTLQFTSGSAGNITQLEITSTTSNTNTFYIDDVQLQLATSSSTSATPSAYQEGTLDLRGVINNPVSLQNTANSTTAFQVQNAAGNNIAAVDTLNDQMDLGSPNHVNGSIDFFDSGDSSGVSIAADSSGEININVPGYQSSTSNNLPEFYSDNSFYQTSASGATWTNSYTDGSGTNRYLLVNLSDNLCASGNTETVTYAGISMSLLGSTFTGAGSPTGSKKCDLLFGLTAPATGANNIVVTVSGTPANSMLSLSVSSWYHVNQSTPYGSVVSASGWPLSVTNAWPANRLVVDTDQIYDGPSCSTTVNPDSGQTPELVSACFDLDNNGDYGTMGISTKQSTGKAMNIGWSGDGNWGELAVDLVGDNGGSGTFGDTATGGTTDNDDQQQYQCTYFPNTLTGKVTSIVFEFENVSGTYNSAQAAIYANSNGAVGSLLGNSSTTTIVNGANTFNLGTSVQVQAGVDYWLCSMTNTPSGSGNNGVDNNVYDTASSTQYIESFEQNFTYGTWPTAMPDVDSNGYYNGYMYESYANVSLDNPSGTALTINNTGQTTFQNASDSSSAFQVQTAGGSDLLDVDTLNDQVEIGGSEAVSTTTDTEDDDSTSYINISNTSTAYYLYNDAGGGTGTTVYFDILGLPNTEGTLAYIISTSQKSSGSGTDSVEVQINGQEMSIVNEASTATAHMDYTVMYSNGSWHIVGYGPTSTTATIEQADYAEWIDYSGDSQPQPGDVLTVGSQAVSVEDSSTPYDSHLMGVVSTDPYQVGGADDGHSVELALTGRVPVKVDLQNGPIEPGDPLTSSSTPGVAMKATGPGEIIGTALEAYDGTGSSNLINVQLHVGYNDPSNGSQIQGNTNVSGDLYVSGDENVGGDLTVAGTATAQNLVVTGSTSLANAVVSGDVSAGSVTVTGLVNAQTINVSGDENVGGNLTIGGHLITAGTTPTAVVNTSSAGSLATCTVSGDDTSGTITLTSNGTGQASGQVCIINFSKAFDSPPHTVISPTDSDSVGVDAYAQSTSKSLTLYFIGVPKSGETYNFNYFSSQ